MARFEKKFNWTYGFAQVDEVKLRQLKHINQGVARSAGCVRYSKYRAYQT
jgi:hypothetical protein